VNLDTSMDDDLAEFAESLEPIHPELVEFAESLNTDLPTLVEVLNDE
jgi:hypothetical protein